MINRRFFALIIISGFLMTFTISSASDLHAQERYVIPDSVDQFVLDPANFNPDKKDTLLLRHEPFGRKKEAVYTADTLSDGTPVIRGRSDGAISSVVSSISADPEKFKYLTWNWKIDSVLEKGDLSSKEGDDFPARIYVTFEFSVKNLPLGERIKYRFYKTFTSFDIPLRSLNYVWASNAEVGTIRSNPYTDWVKYVVVQSGNDKAGEWIHNKRNILEDYKKAFGEDPKNITGITIMTDSDNTGGTTEAWFGKIILSKE